MWLLLCWDIVATYVDNLNVRIGMRYKQQCNKMLADGKWNKSIEAKLNVKIQLID